MPLATIQSTLELAAGALGQADAPAAPVSPWFPFANSVLNVVQAVAIAWLVQRDRRRSST